ncbi:cytolethal distending toxin subunit B family protein [Bordetella trematum]|uniref:cytolethal distending toxin subunit B family protein n=1 Tax=Bordetella trematum TaxID=123899 RepID=UPI003989DFD6
MKIFLYARLVGLLILGSLWFSALRADTLDEFTVATWNMQGSSASSELKWDTHVRTLISGTGRIGVLLLQEAGLPPRSARRTSRVIHSPGIPIDEYEWDLGTSTRPSPHWIYHSRVDVGANRVNLAIVTQRRADDVIVLRPPTYISRPIIGVRFNGAAFFTTHALANGGSDALAIVRRVFDYFASQPPPVRSTQWLIGGDFNRSPDSLQRAIDPVPIVRTRVGIVSQNAPTQRSGGILDYFLVGSVDRLPLITSLASLLYSRLLGQLASDHYPVGLLRRSN